MKRTVLGFFFKVKFLSFATSKALGTRLKTCSVHKSAVQPPPFSHQCSSRSHHLFLSHHQPPNPGSSAPQAWITAEEPCKISHYLHGLPDPSGLVLRLGVNLSLTLITPSHLQPHFIQFPCFKQISSSVSNSESGPFRLFTATLWVSFTCPWVLHPSNWLHPSHLGHTLFPSLLSADFLSSDATEITWP